MEQPDMLVVLISLSQFKDVNGKSLADTIPIKVLLPT